jgi:hypothetical protein
MPFEEAPSMKYPSILALAAAVVLTLPFSPLLGDWVVLKSGKRLQGIDYRKQGDKGFLFTLETGKTVFLPDSDIISYQGSLPGETIEFRGRKISLRDKIRILRKEEAARKVEMMRTLERWVGEGPGAKKAREEFLALPGEEREKFFCYTLARSQHSKARYLAAENLVEFTSPQAIQSLASSYVNELHPQVRKASMTSLLTLNHSRTGDYFIPYLGSRNAVHRIRAADALAAFPTERAVPAIIAVATMRWTDFGRAYFFQGTQRAYISDYELVSGGTGFSLVEVADPIISTVQSGVVLDVKVTQVEMKRYIRALRKITGVNFGGDFNRWKAWWNARRDEV